MLRKLFLIILSLHFCSLTLSAKSVPGTPEVKKTLQSLIGKNEQQIPARKRPDSSNSDFLKKLLTFFSSLKNPYVITVLLLFLGFFIFLIRKGRHTLAQDLTIIPPNTSISTSSIGITPSLSGLLDQAATASSSGNYREGIHFLYQATLFYLYQQHFLQEGKAYTNRDIMAQLAMHPEYQKNFSAIAFEAELALFSHREISEKEFNRVRDILQTSFLGRNS